MAKITPTAPPTDDKSEKTVDVKARLVVNHNGTLYGPGDTFTCGKAEAQALLAVAAVELVQG